MDKNLSELVSLLTHISVWDKLDRQVKEHHQSKVAPDFRLFNFFRVDEMALSRCLAFLLNPQGAHGQGKLFLSRFIKLLPENVMFQASDDVRIRTEYTLPDSRRLDLLLTQSNSAIAIENKPWAEDQPRQLHDYAHWMNGRYFNNHWLLVYLCNNDISEYSLPANSSDALKKNTFPLTFYHLVEWLEECLLHVQAPQIRLFIDELILFINEQINGESKVVDSSELSQLILSSAENVRATFLAAQSLRNIKSQMWHQFINYLETQLSPLGAVIEAEHGLHEGKKECGFLIQFNPNDIFALKWQFEYANHKGLCFGIVSYQEPNVERDAVLYSKIHQSMSQTFSFVSEEKMAWWPWWCWIESAMEIPRHWDMNPEAWLCLLDKSEKSFAQSVINIAKEMKEKFPLELLRG